MFLYFSCYLGRQYSRHFDHLSAELVANDGVTDDAVAREQESFLDLKEMYSSEEHCQIMYGFFPCATNVLSQFFLIVTYGYLLYQGEYYASGD